MLEYIRYMMVIPIYNPYQHVYPHIFILFTDAFLPTGDPTRSAGAAGNWDDMTNAAGDGSWDAPAGGDDWSAPAQTQQRLGPGCRWEFAMEIHGKLRKVTGWGWGPQSIAFSCQISG